MAQKNSSEWLPFVIDRRAKCTRSLYFLFRDYRSAIDGFYFIVHLSTRTDLSVKEAAKALAETAKTEEERQRYLDQVAGPDVAFEQLKQYATYNSQSLVSYINQAFSCYISHIIRSCLQRNDNMLRSRESVSVDEIIDFKNKKDLVAYLIDRKINELSYGGMRQLENYIGERIGLSLFKTPEERNLQIIFNELRNIIVHNRGYVNDVLLSRVSEHEGFKFEKNKRFHTDLETIIRLTQNSMQVAQRFDQEVAQKFKLQQKRYETWVKTSPAYIT